MAVMYNEDLSRAPSIILGLRNIETVGFILLVRVDVYAIPILAVVKAHQSLP